MTDESVKKVLWWVCLLLAPSVLVTIELFHPAGFSQHMYQYLSKPEPYNPQYKALGYFGPQWWFALHMIQTVMMGLVAVGLLLVVDKITSSDSRAATTFGWLSRFATFVFVVYYTALDSIGGIGLGKTIEITERLSGDGTLGPDQVKAVETVLNATWNDPWVGGVGSFISQTGSWAVFISALTAAVGLFLAKRAPWPALVLLIAFGWELQVSHTMPHGPIAFALLIIAGFWIWLKRKPSTA
jgi:hypothetical protein